MTAFRSVLLQKQSKYQEVISWLEGKIETIKAKKGKDCIRLRTLLRDRNPNEKNGMEG
jgi:hypothetical protein